MFFWGGGTFPSAIACFKYHPAVRPKRSYSIPFVDVGGRCLTLSLIKSASDRAVWVQPKRAGPQMVGEAGQNDKMHCKGTERKTQSMDCMGSILTCISLKQWQPTDASTLPLHLGRLEYIVSLSTVMILECCIS